MPADTFHSKMFSALVNTLKTEEGEGPRTVWVWVWGRDKGRVKKGQEGTQTRTLTAEGPGFREGYE